MRGPGTMPAERQPSAAAVTARAMIEAAAGPKSRAEARAAGWATVAISAGGIAFRNAAFTPTYRTVMRPVPTSSAIGRFRSGRATSPAAATISFQP